MAHTITGKLNKPANQFQAGDYTGFGVRIGVQYYDRKSKQKEWTNYSAVLFAAQPAKIKFYQDVLIEGAIISISGEAIKIDEYEGKYSLELINANLEYSHTSSQQAPQQQSQPQTPQNTPVDDDFSDGIPF